MKRALSLLFVLTLLFAGISPAHAAPADAVLLRDGADGFSGNIQNIAAAGDTLYALTYDAVYAFEGESAEPARYELSLPGVTEEANGAETTSSLDAIAIVSHGGGLCLLAAQTQQTIYEEDGETIWETAIDGVSLYALDLAGDTATAGAEVCALDWEDLILGGADEAYLAEADGLCASGDFLACKSYDESGNEFYAIADLTDGSVALYYADELPGEDALLTPYRDGELLCITREWGSDGNISRICRFDPASGATDELCALATGEGYLEAPAYRAENDTLYYLLDGQLWALPGMDASQSEAVAGFPLDSPRGQAALTASGLYAAADFFTLVRRDTDPAQRASVRLAVLSGHSENVENAAYAFGAERGDVEVTLVQQSGDVLEAMLGRSPEIDVYCFSASLPEYEALRARGFLPSLDGLTNTCSFVESCYPFARDACTVDGAVVALPVEAGFNAPLSYDAGALAKLGLTKGDLPATWPEFFLSLASLSEAAERAGLYLFDPQQGWESLRDVLFDAMLAEYAARISYTEDGYDTPAFRAALEAFAAVDWANIGLLSDEQAFAYEADDAPFAGDGTNRVLFAAYADVSAQSDMAASGLQWLPLGFSEDVGPTIAADVTVAFVNPFSAHPDEARAFVETLAVTMDAVTRLELSPACDEPVPLDTFETDLADYDRSLADARAALEAAEGEDRQTFAEMIDFYEQARADYLAEDGWKVSASALAAYRQRAAYMLLARNLFSGESDMAAYEAAQQFKAGALSADGFVRQLDRMLSMQRRENA